MKFVPLFKLLPCYVSDSSGISSASAEDDSIKLSVGDSSKFPSNFNFSTSYKPTILFDVSPIAFSKNTSLHINIYIYIYIYIYIL